MAQQTPDPAPQATQQAWTDQAVPPVDPVIGPAAAPLVGFLKPVGDAAISQPLTYGSIQVLAFDPDIGFDDGDGIAFVSLVITDQSSGQVVAASGEYEAPFNFGVDLPPGE